MSDSSQTRPQLFDSLQKWMHLRKQAETIARRKMVGLPENLESLSIEEIRLAFHELQVHQIELEMQNQELQRTQDELEAATTRYFDLYDLAPVGYCTISESGLILEANLAAASLLGVARDGLIRQPISRFITKKDQDRFYLLRKKVLAPCSAQQHPSEQASKLQNCELRMKKITGVEFWVHLRMTVTDDTGNVPVYRVVLIDISERKLAEEQRDKLEDQSRQIKKSESLERMAGAIAHHFNNQLCVVLGNLELYLGEMPDDASSRSNLVNAMQAARRSSEISGLLLTYLGQNCGKPEPLDLSAACHHHLARISAAIPKNIILETEIASPGPVVYANPNQIHLILMHLVNNGWEAIGKASGCVTVATKTLPASDIPKVLFSKTDWQATTVTYGLLEVRDTGSGMTEEEMEKIFDPFFSTKFTGRGLGLAVVAGLVKAWGGTIGVKSEVGKGSIFRVFLPLAADALPREILAWTTPLNFDIGGSVLLVEDDDMVRQMAALMLKHLGFTVFAAADGTEAISLFEKHHKTIRCLVTDLKMPGMDGWQTLAALRKIEPLLPAILSSGYDELEAMSGDYTELPQAFLHKPYEMKDLKHVLGRVLGGQIQNAK